MGGDTTLGWTRVVTETGTRTGRRFLGLLVALLVWSPVAVGAGADTEEERRAVLEQRRALASEIDVLEASDAEIHRVLDDLDRSIATQQDAVAEAEDAARAAAAAVTDARIELRFARRDVAVLEAAIVEMAVASYVHPPTADLVQSLQAASLSEALLQHAYLDARAKRDLDLLDLLEQAESTAEQRAADVEVAAAEAALAVEAATAALDALEAEQQRQLSVATDLQDRIDASLAEAAVLAEVDAELAEQIAAEQAALIARIPPPPVVPQVEVPEEAPVEAPPALAAPTPTTEPVADDDDEAPAPVPEDREPPVDVDAPPLRTVRGITVHEAIADEVAALVDAAEADGISLGGWGYRSTERQIELRIAHCGPTYYDIWIRPASTCQPPTAVPGRSLHEQGKAVDFTFEGRTITSRSSPAFAWLRENAATYGLRNLPSEPWHWSTTGS